MKNCLGICGRTAFVAVLSIKAMACSVLYVLSFHSASSFEVFYTGNQNIIIHEVFILCQIIFKLKVKLLQF